MESEVHLDPPVDEPETDIIAEAVWRLLEGRLSGETIFAINNGCVGEKLTPERLGLEPSDDLDCNPHGLV